MPSLRDLDIVHRLNAPTRSAATRRRRLRKTCACLCVAGAALVATGGGGSSTDHAAAASTSSSPSPGARPELQGRQLVPIRADESLVARVATSSRVDVWAPDGTRLASGAPVVPPNDRSSHQVDTSPSGGNAQLLVALTPADVTRIARHGDAGQPSWSGLFVTMRP